MHRVEPAFSPRYLHRHIRYVLVQMKALLLVYANAYLLWHGCYTTGMILMKFYSATHKSHKVQYVL